ncbi:MAG: diacylglycerol kinase family protein [Candidatus Levybacteria bacterium]|nr:diacylglycerol kinase family protein [Candidatus Levybacteria bacterium]
MIYEKSILKSFRHALEGLWYALKYNRNLRIHFFVALVVIMVGIFFRINAYEMSILGVVIILVISAEMINTSIEEMVNLITSEHKREAKIAKDVAAGMVLIVAIGSVIIGFLIFAPYILRLFY